MNKIIEENYELICNENAVSAYEFVEEMFQLTKYRQGE